MQSYQKWYHSACVALWGRVDRARPTLPESGQGLLEYALILVLVAVVVIAALATFGGFVNDSFLQAGCEIANATNDAC